MEFLKYFSIRYSYYIYTVLRSVLMLRSGLEFEREYSAVIEGYRYVYYFSYKGINQKKFFLIPVYYTWPGAGAGWYSANAVEYCTSLECILYNNEYTILHLIIRLSRISRAQRTVHVLYVTQN